MPDKKATAVVTLEGWPDECLKLVKSILRNHRFSVAELGDRRQSRASLLVTDSIELARRLRKRYGAKQLTVVFVLGYIEKPIEPTVVKEYAKKCAEAAKARNRKPNTYVVLRPEQFREVVQKISEELIGVAPEDTAEAEAGVKFPTPFTGAFNA